MARSGEESRRGDGGAGIRLGAASAWRQDGHLRGWRVHRLRVRWLRRKRRGRAREASDRGRRGAPGAVRHQRRYGLQRWPGVRRPDRGLHSALRARVSDREASRLCLRDRRRRHQGKGLLAWEFGKHRGSLGRGDEFDERVAREAIDILGEGHPRQVKYDDAPGGPLRIFVDTYPAQPTIVIFGAVHIGVALAQLAKSSPVDSESWWSTRAACGPRRERFPTADEIHIMHADDYLKDHPLGSNTYVAVLSHDPKLDDPAFDWRAAESRALRRRHWQPQNPGRPSRASEGTRASATTRSRGCMGQSGSISGPRRRRRSAWLSWGR